MSLKRNILANYVSQIYVTVIGIVTLPLYLKYLGAEAYGLVGFFAMLQAWLGLLDMGLTPTSARESARFRGGAIDAQDYRRLLRALEGVFLALAIVGGGVVYAGSGYIAHHWLKVTSLPVTEVQEAVRIMAVIIAMRWMCGPYRGTISGTEQLVWLGMFNAVIATLRFVVVVPVFILVGTSVTTFFRYQFCVAVVEFTGLVLYAYRLLPAISVGQRLPWSWAPLQAVLKFSLTIAFTSSVWVVVTQMDKLVLSKLLPLAEYGYFTLAVLVAGGVLVISSPVSAAIMPRMTRLEAERDYSGLIQVYRQATQLVAVIAGAASVTVVFFAEPLLWAWTGDTDLAHRSAPILILYALGNAILSVAAFPYYLQYAKGDLRLHLIGNAVFLFLMVPSVIWAANRYGGVGAGCVWLGMNLVSFIAWLPFVHRKFAPGLNMKWYLQDILAIYSVEAVAGCGIRMALPRSENRFLEIGLLVAVGILEILAGTLASSEARTRFANLANRQAALAHK